MHHATLPNKITGDTKRVKQRTQNLMLLSRCSTHESIQIQSGSIVEIGGIIGGWLFFRVFVDFKAYPAWFKRLYNLGGFEAKFTVFDTFP